MQEKGVKRESLSNQVSKELEKMIENGEYKLGERIPTEPDLMKMFQVSRNTIREAIKGLTLAGLLETKQGNGTFVRSTNRFEANMKQKYETVSIEDIREARNCIEVTIAHLAANRREKEDLNLIEKFFNERKNLKVNVRENTKADIEFHMAIAKSCHNLILIDLYQSISDYLESHITERKLESSLSTEEIDKLHEELYKAIINKDSEAASVAARNILDI